MSIWQKGPGMSGDQVIASGDGFYISYVPNPGIDLGLFQSDEGQPETALCQDGKYYILNGDFRDAYGPLILQGFAACKKFYDENASEHSSWSCK